MPRQVWFKTAYVDVNTGTVTRELSINGSYTIKESDCYDHVFQNINKKYNKSHAEPLPAGITPHVLRHTFCTEMANAGMNPKTLQAIMGHSSIKMTMDYYAHASVDSAQSEIDRLLG